ncbi:AAA family ATPase [Legionella clemsonensis]|uniref:SPOR domain-containing protein n=1 Tax=Legionella clemsonensis TaxID=1867846 RepID=A0A222P0V2_9GAMM|nr:AAA family ATPase [Legionella clemsonensis]ASQ45470.1 hypothetical protein clem_04560 [Legionella clemsonensis]
MQSVMQELEGKETVSKNTFKPSAWFTKIDFINHLILFNNALITVLAEEGGGKTTFCELLQANLDPQIKSYIIKATPPFSPAEVLAQLATSLHLRTDYELSFVNLIQQINERKAHVVVIIDDAQHVPDNFLHDFLTALKQQGEQCFFHFCLVSDFSLVASLNKLEAASLENLIHRVEPGALTEVETKTYLLSKLSSPKRIDLTMSDKRLEQFYQLTGGNIARINKQMVSFFCPESLNSTGLQKSSYSKYIGLGATCAVALLASVYLWQNQDLFKNRKNLARGNTQIVTAVEHQLPSLIPKVPQTANEENVLISQIPSYNQRMESYIPAFTISAKRQDTQPSPLKRVVEIVLDEEEQENSSLVVMDKVVVIPKPIGNGSLSNTPVASLERKVVSTRETPKPTFQPAFAPTTTIASKVQINAQRGQYTLQLLASQNLEDIKRFVNHHHLTHTKIRIAKRQGVSWYVLTLGEYSRFEQAQQAASQLPTTLTQYKPWIRSTSGLTALG